MTNHRTNGLNTAVGFESMQFDSSGSINTAVGWRSLRYVKNGFENTALGVGTIEFTDSSYQNTAVGRYSMYAIGGRENTAMGYLSMGNGTGVPTTGIYTLGATAIGAYAGYKNIGAENTFLGRYAGGGFSVDSLRGIENTGLGSHTLTFTTSGRSNTAVGMGSLNTNVTGNGNVGVGTRALVNNSTSSYNVAVGDSALFNINSGSNNTGIGAFANTNAINQTNATAIGYRAFVSQNNSMVLGSINGVNGATSDTKVGIGTTTPDSTFSVSDNFLVGSSGTVQFADNVPVMNYMFKTCCSAADRMVIAHSSIAPNWGLQYQDAADRFNFLAGGTPVLTADLGASRVGIGTISPQKRLHVFTGTSGATTNAATQILMEDDATSYLEMSTPVANENGILSSVPGVGIRSAVIFRQDSSIRLRSGGNFERLIIDKLGYAAFNRNPPSTGGSAGALQVSNTASTTDDQFGLYNQLGNHWTMYVPNNATPTLSLFFDGNFRGSFANGTGVYTAFSDRRYKKDITDFDYGINTLKALKPYKYSYIDSKPGDHTAVGFMAQDLLTLFPEAVYKNQDKQGKEFYTVDYNTFSVLSIKAIQEQQQIIDKQQKQIDDLLKRVEKLENK
jgi:hypothetical protein